MHRVLNSQQVASARRQVATGTRSITDLANKYDVNFMTLWHAIRGHSWTWLRVPPVPVSRSLPLNQTIRDVGQRADRLVASGLQRSEVVASLVEEFPGVSRTTLYRHVNRALARAGRMASL